ncbi:MAG: MBL fold metallo-hydrolase [Phycisphaeraceae bacterium]
MSLELLFLGTGTSAGVPMIGCECAVCMSRDPHDQRTRASVLISYGARGAAAEPLEGAPPVRRVLIDTSPELRMQITRHRINALDAVLYTHAHADHIFGLDDLRRFNIVMRAPIDIYAEGSVLAQFREMFRYIFEPHLNENQSFIPQLVAHAILPVEKLVLHEATFTPIRLMHGRLPVLGFRVDHEGKSLAYCTDVSSVPAESMALLRHLDVLVIDALRYRAHPTHMTVDEAMATIEELKPKQAYLTHIAHEISHAELSPRLPRGVAISYDGLRITL